MSDMTEEQQLAYTQQKMNEVTDKIVALRNELLHTQDARMVFSCFAAITSGIGAELIAAKVYEAQTVIRVFHECAISAVFTIKTKPGVPVVYMDGDQKLGRKQ